MAAQATLHAACLPATAKFKAASKASILSNSLSFLQTCSASQIYKKSRIFCSPPSTSVTKVSVVAALTAGDKDRSTIIRFKDEATITSEPFEEKKLKVNVKVTPVGTRRAFDIVLENMKQSAPPVPGFRRAKGGKSVIPKDILYQMLGPSRVDSFVVKEIVCSSVLEYVEKEGFKVKKDFKMIQSNEELNAQFKAGKEFLFEAILTLDDAETEAAGAEES